MMLRRSYPVLLVALTVGLVATVASAQSLEAEVTPLVQTSCLRCHGDRTAIRQPSPSDRSTLCWGTSEKAEMPTSAGPTADS